MVEREFIDPVGYEVERTPDVQYQDMVKKILSQGQSHETVLQINDKNSVTGEKNAKAMYIDMHTLRFDLSNGAPIITERSIKGSYSKAIGELTAFINGAHTLDQLEEMGGPRDWWEGQVTPAKTAKRGLEPGDFGPGSYGAAFHDFPTSEGQGFNQFKAIVDQIRERPELRTHIITPFIPQYQYRGTGYEQKVVVVPCHGLLHVRITENNELTLKHFQRSGDAMLGIPHNLAQYTALTIMLAQATGYKPKEYIHVISDAHLYENHLEQAEEMVSNLAKPFPKLLVATDVLNDEEYKNATGFEFKDVFAYRRTDFNLDEYEAGPTISGLEMAR